MGARSALTSGSPRARSALTCFPGPASPVRRSSGHTAWHTPHQGRPMCAIALVTWLSSAQGQERAASVAGVAHRCLRNRHPNRLSPRTTSALLYSSGCRSRCCPARPSRGSTGADPHNRKCTSLQLSHWGTGMHTRSLCTPRGGCQGRGSASGHLRTHSARRRCCWNSRCCTLPLEQPALRSTAVAACRSHSTVHSSRWGTQQAGACAGRATELGTTAPVAFLSMPAHYR